MDRRHQCANRAAAAAARRRHCRRAAVSCGGTRIRRSHRRSRRRGRRLAERRPRSGRQCRRFPYRRHFTHRPEGSQPRRGADHRRRDRPRVAPVPRCRGGARAAHGQSLDRRRGGAQALPGPVADQRDRAAGLCALAEGRQRERDRCRRHGARAVRGGPLSRFAASGRQGRRACRLRFSRHSRPLSRCPRHAARLDFRGRAALEFAAHQWPRRAVAGNQRRAGARAAGRSRSRKETLVARHHGGRSAANRSRHRAAVGCGGTGARRRAQGQEEEKGGDA